MSLHNFNISCAERIIDIFYIISVEVVGKYLAGIDFEIHTYTRKTQSNGKRVVQKATNQPNNNLHSMSVPANIFSSKIHIEKEDENFDLARMAYEM